MTLYHYCSVDTFYQIVKNKTIRLSDITKSNDSAELTWITKYFEEVFSEVYDKEKAQYFKNAYPKEEFLDKVSSFSEEHFSFSNNMFYVACFSEEGDMLSQWRGYADDGRGVAIGINSDVLNSLLPKDEGKTFKLGEVIYSEFGQKQIVKRIAEELINQLKDDISNTKTSGISFFYSVAKLSRKAIFAKSPFFKEEEEHRLCTLFSDNSAAPPSDKPSYQPRHGHLVSYFDFSFAKNPDIISEIIIGPKSRLNIGDVSLFLNSCELNSDRIKIAPSGGTYR